MPTASSRTISAKASGSTLGSYRSLGDATRAVMVKSQAATEGLHPRGRSRRRAARAMRSFPASAHPGGEGRGDWPCAEQSAAKHEQVARLTRDVLSPVIRRR